MPDRGLKSEIYRALGIVSLTGLLCVGQVQAQDAGDEKAPPDSAKRDAAVVSPLPTENDAPPTEGERDQKAVIVQGKRPTNRIDRQVYDLADQPENAGESTADALQKVPGVNVDPSGNVTLRGNSVDILVNGKPSALFAGDNRAAALRAMPSSIIASIEVMSTPGAQFSSSGAGGIINIVTKRATDPGSMISVTGKLYTNGDYGGDAFIQHNKGRLATTASLSVSTDRNPMSSRFFQTDLSTAAQRSTDSNAQIDSESRSMFGNVSVEYDAGPFDTVTGLLNVVTLSSDTAADNVTSIFESPRVASDRFSSANASTFSNRNATAGLSWTHIGKELGEALKVNGSVSRLDSRMDGDTVTTYTLSRIPQNLGVFRQNSAMDTDGTAVQLSADYNSFLGDDQIAVGVLFDHNDVRRDMIMSSLYQPEIEAPVINPLLTTSFRYRQTISAAYATYQKAVGLHWVLLGGVRVEALDFTSPMATSGSAIKVAYTNINPSFFATYVISDEKKIRLNYSRRLERPTPDDLNPSLAYVNAQTVTKGEPALRPQEVNSYEMSYEHSKFGRSYSLRLYGLQTDKVINPVTTFIDDPQGVGNQVIQISRRNAGSNLQTGLQVTVNLFFAQHWSINANADLYNQRMTTPDTGHRSLEAVSGQLGIAYMGKKDTISINYYMMGKQLTGDGYLSESGGGSISYNRNLSATVSLSVTASNIFQSKERASVRDTGFLRTSNSMRPMPSKFYLSISKRFGSGMFKIPE